MDIEKAIINQNTIIDFFNLGTPGAGDDDKVLTYDNTSGKIQLETATGGGISAVVDDTTTEELGGTLDVNDKDIAQLNNGEKHPRGDAKIYP